MNRGAPHCVAGAIALGLVLFAIGAGAQPNSTTTTTTTVYSTDATPWMAFEADRVNALRRIVEAGITNHDIEKVISLLRDLRDMENSYRSDLYFINQDILTAHSTAEMNRAEKVSIESTQRRYVDRRDRIWRSIADRIGQSKADVLRAACEPMPDRTAYYVPSEHMQRIDQLIAKWDEIHPGLVVATTTTTVTTTPVGMAHRTYVVPMEPAPLTYRTLVDLMEQKLAAYYGVEPAAWYFGSWYAKEFTSPDYRYVRDRASRYWDWW